MDMATEEVLQKEQWIVEANAVIDDIKAHVIDASVSDVEGSDKNVFLNITTKEGNKITVEMSAQGFMIVDKCHNSRANPEELWYETPYALLDSISPGYRNSFGSSLVERLLQVQEEQSFGSVD